MERAQVLLRLDSALAKASRNGKRIDYLLLEQRGHNDLIASLRVGTDAFDPIELRQALISHGFSVAPSAKTLPINSSCGEIHVEITTCDNRAYAKLLRQDDEHYVALLDSAVKVSRVGDDYPPPFVTHPVISDELRVVVECPATKGEITKQINIEQLLQTLVAPDFSNARQTNESPGIHIRGDVRNGRKFLVWISEIAS